MARLPRIKVEGEDGWYHLWNAAAGEKRAFPLQNLVHRRKLIGLLRHYAGIRRCVLHVARAAQQLRADVIWSQVVAREQYS